jgi:MFS family permease
LGGGSVLARLVSGPAANAIGSLRTYRWCFVILALSYALWMAAGSSFGMIAIFAAVNGFAYGGYVAVSALVIAEAHGTTNLGSALGIYYTGAAFGGLVGPPLAGAVLDATDSYLAGMVAGLLTAATLILVAAVPMDSDGSMPPIPQR